MTEHILSVEIEIDTKYVLISRYIRCIYPFPDEDSARTYESQLHLLFARQFPQITCTTTGVDEVDESNREKCKRAYTPEEFTPELMLNEMFRGFTQFLKTPLNQNKTAHT